MYNTTKSTTAVAPLMTVSEREYDVEYRPGGTMGRVKIAAGSTVCVAFDDSGEVADPAEPELSLLWEAPEAELGTAAV